MGFYKLSSGCSGLQDLLQQRSHLEQRFTINATIFSCLVFPASLPLCRPAELALSDIRVECKMVCIPKEGGNFVYRESQFEEIFDTV
jgi:hypothetical protein